MEGIQKEKKENKIDNFIDSLIDFIFSKDKMKWLIPIVFLGAILRFLMARNVSALGDEMIHGPHAIGFLHSGLISTILHCPLWFYLTDIVFKFLGVTMFSTRFLSFFYGTLSIVVVYLISSKIFNKKVGLISAFLLAASAFTLRYTLIEMDLPALFFLLLAIYFFIVSMEKNKFPFLAAVCIGIAALIKTLSLFFVPGFLIAFFIFNKNKSSIKKNIKHILIFGLIITLFFSPIFAHNYLWYKDKGQVDTYFAQYFFPEMREVYASQAGYDSGFLFSEFLNGAKTLPKEIFQQDPFIVFFGILGLILSFSIKEKRKYLYFLLSFQFSGLIFLLLSNHLATHYTTMIPLFCIFGGFSINKFSKKLKNINSKKVLAITLLIILIFPIYSLFPYLTSQSGLSKMRDYTSNMDKNSIVVADARIYRGRIAWLFHDFHYLEASYLQNILLTNQNLPGQDVPTKMYFIECVHDDCGWGPSKALVINESSEELVKIFSSQTQPEKIIYGGGGYVEKKGEQWFNIYSITTPLKPEIFDIVDSTHSWFYYPVNYLPKEQIFDNYEVYGLLDNLTYKFAWLVIICSVILSILLPIYLFIELFKNNSYHEVISNNSSI